jgi:PAS domain S-box-containing protein
MPTHTDSDSTRSAAGQDPAKTTPDGPAAIAILHRILAERSPLPIAMTEGPAHVLCGANSAFCRLLDTERTVLLGKPLVEVVPALGAGGVLRLLDRVYRTGESASAADQEYIHPERGHSYWTYTIWSIPDGQGRPAGLMLLVTDTTAHHRDEQDVVDARVINEQLLIAGLREQELAEQLQRQLAFTSAITTSLGEGVYALDLAGRFSLVNPAAERMLGWTEADLLGRDAQEVIHVQSANGARKSREDSLLLDVMRSDMADRDEDAVLTRRDGTTFPAAYSAAPIIAAGQVVGAVVTFRDMTEVRRLQQRQEEYLGLISHDLRTPLTSILGHAELLQRWLAEQGLEREINSAKAVVESGTRMQTLIEDLLARSRREAGSADLHLAPTDLVQLARRIVDQTATSTARERIDLEGVEQLPVVVDPAQIERVVANLLTNALKFSAPESRVVVRVYSDGNRAMVSIADQGVGIDSKDLAHLFEKYYRARMVGQVDGTGLGLYISQLILEAHGGHIWAESELGTGSTFMFSLPMGEL